MTVAAFMEIALYDPAFGYYARAAQRSGRAGDFFTSVDVGPVFGELLEIQLAEMHRLLQTSAFECPTFDLVEAGAGNARLSADILRAARDRDPGFYSRIRLHLVEASGAARGAQMATLDDVGDRLTASGASLPEAFEGVLLANELLDAFPVHQVVMREDGLREVWVAASGFTRSGARGDLRLVEGPPSTPALQAYLDRLGVTLEPGWRVEINLRALEWIREAARRLQRGFIIVIDYGHEARDLYSATHAGGTLTTFSRHRSGGCDGDSAAPPWLERPGEQDVTAHVDFTSVRDAAQGEGLTAIGFLDQTYFVLGLLPALPRPQSAIRPSTRSGRPQAVEGRNSQLKTLLMPGGLGSTHKVMIFGKGVGTPALQGCSFCMRVT